MSTSNSHWLPLLGIVDCVICDRKSSGDNYCAGRLICTDIFQQRVAYKIFVKRDSHSVLFIQTHYSLIEFSRNLPVFNRQNKQSISYVVLHFFLANFGVYIKQTQIFNMRRSIIVPEEKS